MQTALGIIVTILVLTFLVVIHEAAHAFVARLCGMRVTELFVGLPYGPSVSVRSPRSGIRYGATLALLGGYTRISGMAYRPDRRLPLALALVNARGRLSVEELAEVLRVDPDEAGMLLDALADVGSVEPVDGRHGRGDATVFQTVRRDASGRTVHDRGHDFLAPGATEAGAPLATSVAPEELLARDVARTYAGKGFLRRAAVLVAGIAANILCAIVIVCAFLMLHGVQVVQPQLAAVQEGSPAAQAGMAAGDVITAINGTDVSDGYQAVTTALAQVPAGDEVTVAFAHEGQTREATVRLGDDGMLGVSYGSETRRLPLGQAVAAAGSYAVATAQAIVSLLMPSQTMEVLDQSAGIVGIVAITGQAAERGAWDVLLLAASLSLSLGWLNLLPIPPLDGGKLLIEAIQAVIRRPVPMAVQSAISAAGMALILLLFVVMVVLDLTRLATGVYA